MQQIWFFERVDYCCAVCRWATHLHPTAETPTLKEWTSHNPFKERKSSSVAGFKQQERMCLKQMKSARGGSFDYCNMREAIYLLHSSS